MSVWTCADTLQLLAELGVGFAGAAEQEEISEEGIDVTLGQQSEDILTEKSIYLLQSNMDLSDVESSDLESFFVFLRRRRKEVALCLVVEVLQLEL